jgi:signal transduction histidine kinase
MTRREVPYAHDPSFDGSFGLMSAAHELKAPAALIRQLALELRDVAGVEHERQLLDQIILTSERSLRLTGDLTRTARLDDAMFELEPLNPQQLCEEVAHELTPLYKAHGKTVEVRGRRTAPLVVANRELLRRVLMNFGDNALQYGSDTSPVTFTVEREQERVTVGVRDRGPILPHRGAPLRTAVTGRPSSSGLGLAIAQKFAETMQGHIGTRRHHDGMTFYINMMASEQLSLL